MAVHLAGKAVFVAVRIPTDQSHRQRPCFKTYRKVVGNFDVHTRNERPQVWGRPNHLTFAPDGKRLFVTVGLLNAVAVVRPGGDTAGSMKPESKATCQRLVSPHDRDQPDGQTLFLTVVREGNRPNKPNRPFLQGSALVSTGRFS
jgi:hypothetical protein